MNGEDECEDDDGESGDEVIDDRIEECLRARPPVGAVCCGRADCARPVLVTGPHAGWLHMIVDRR